MMRAAIHNSGNQKEKRFPFICRKEPFIGSNKTAVLPFIGWKIPLISFKGFTLVELVIAMTIAGVLMAIAAPAMRTFVSSNRLTSQINDLLADINLTRNEAIKRNTTAGICATAVGGSTCDASGNWANGWLVYYVCQAGDLSGCTAGSNVVVKKHEALTGNNTLTAPAAQIVYGKSGIIASGAGQITLTDPKTNKQRIVCIVTTGRPSLSEGACA